MIEAELIATLIKPTTGSCTQLPITAIREAINLPSSVTGEKSPYQTGVKVTIYKITVSWN